MRFHKLPTTYIDYVSLSVSNLEKSMTFYQEVLGFSVLEKNEKQVSLTANHEDPIIKLEENSEALTLDNRASGLFHFALLLPSREELADFLANLIKLGIQIEGAADHFVSEAIYLSDLDGHGIEVYVDRASESWKWSNNHVKMGTERLDLNELLKLNRKSDEFILPHEAVMGHIHLQVADLEASSAFYKTVFGLNSVSEIGSHARFISNNKYHHHIGLNTWNSLGKKVSSNERLKMNYFHVNLTIENREKVVKNLKSSHYVFNKREDVYQTEDPSGNIILF